MNENASGGQRVLVTGGTRGLGRAVALAFAERGAKLFVTHRWGSVSEETIASWYRERDLPLPDVLESDAGDAGDIESLMAHIRDRAGGLDVIISNVAFGQVAGELERLKRRSLDLTIGYSAWPVVALTQAAKRVLGDYPRYVVGISSDGSDVCHPGYDYVGSAKAVLETLCRYLALRLVDKGVRVNVLRPGLFDTQSSRAVFGDATLDAIRSRVPEALLEPEQVATTCVALCSGLMDAVTGQVITVDNGWSLHSPVSWLARGSEGSASSEPADD